MSSWQEYKKIKKRDAEDVETSSNLNTEVNKGNMSSWQKFKQEKENRKTTITTEETNTIGKTIQKLADSGKYITKKTGAGVLSGTAGILQAGLTDIANSLRKGEQKNGAELTNDLLNSIIGLTNPTNNIGRMVPKQTEKMLKTIFDKDKNALEKITTLGMDAVTEATDSIGIKRVSDSVLNIAGNFNNKLDDNVLNLNDIISEPINNINSKLTEESENYGTFTNLLADAGQSIGNMVPSMAASAITKNPTIGLATMGISAKGQSTQEALNKGAELDEAIKIGNTKGMIEIGTEMLTGGVNIFGKGALDDIVQKGVVDKVKNNVAKFLVKQGVNASGEVLEETISDILGNVIDKGTVDPDAKYTLKDWEDTAITTVLTTLILNTITGGMVNDIKEINKKNKTDNEQKVYDNEVKERTASKTKQATIEQAYNEQIKAQKNLGIEITEDLKDQIMKKVENAYDNGTLKSTELSKKDRIKIEEQVEKDMQEGNISTENIMKTLGENQDISKDNLLMKSMYENEQKYNSYKVEQTDNEKVNVLMQSAADAGMNNTSKTRKKVDLISKLVKDTDRQYKFVSPEQLKEMGYNENANGLINKSTGEILINAHSDKGIQSIVGHETTHIFDSKDSKGVYSKEYQTLQDVAIEYAKLKGIYDSKVQSITEAYGDLLVNESQIKEELTADLVGDFLFNDEQFIENLALKNRNVFQKIYDYIKHIYKVATAGTEEAKAFENLKYQFDKVYKTISEESNTDTKYSIAGKEGMKNAIKNDTEYLKIERNYNKALQMQENGTDNETIRQTTGWFQDKNGDWKFEFSDKDMTLKENIKLEKSKTYKLGDILEHDTLFTIYPELKNYKIKFTNLQKPSGSYNIYDKDIKINNNQLNKKQYKSNIEGTLIHEIQHAIQDIENFEGGRSSRGSKLAYYESLGEIEASDTKTRFIQEKYKNNDLTSVAPESSKANPKHKNLDNYLKNRKLLDKAKDGVYNYLKKRIGDNNEISKENMAKSNEQNNSLVDDRKRRGYVNEDFGENYKTDKNEDLQNQNQDSRLVVGGRNLENKNSKKGSFNLDKDNQGRALTKEQQEYFKDSKVRDENGNLKTMYHGSNNKFSVFKHGEAYRGSSKASVGYWFTETAEGAKKFANSVWYGDTKTGAKIYEVYLDIKNPKIYEGIDNASELHKIDNKIDNLKEIIRKLENKNIAIEINKQELRWANSKEEIRDIAKYEGIDFEDAENYHNAIKQYNELIEEYDNKKYNDSYELFRADIYKIAGKSANEANIGGTGMYLSNEEEVVKQYVEDLKKQGYDGIIIKNTKFDNETLGKDNSQYVVFNSNQIKNVNNINPTDDLDINLSLTNDTQITGDDISVKDMLKQEKNTIEDEVGKNSIESSTKTTVENTEKSSASKELFDKYKQMEIGKREYEKILRRAKPTEKEKITVDRLLKGEIENDEIPASVDRQRVVDLYNAKAKFYNVEEEIKTQRKEIIKNYRDLAKNMTQNISNWKDKKRGIQYQINTMKRNLRDIISNKSEADALYNEYFKPITKNNATIEKEINKYNERISKFEINDVESQYIQMIGENKYNPDTKLPLETIEEFYDKNKSKIDIKKCQEAVEEFRKIYDELIVKINDTLIENGYKPIEYRQGYFPHFIEDKADTIIGKFAEKLGWKINKDTLPTDIAGITDQFRPGKSWTSFSQQRKGDNTDYNALKGYDNYIRGAMDVIYHTKDIQKLRALENEIRYQYSEKGIQEQIDNIYNDNEFSIEEKEQKINEVFENVKNNPMGNFATELRNYTNNLANKKATSDRGMEQAFGRETYSIMSNIQNRVSANMVGANISSAMTNFIPITQAWSQTSTKNIMRAMRESIATQFKDDGFSNNSTFLTNRTEQADRLYKTGLDKVNDKLGYMFDIVDSFTSNVIVRAKYYDNIESGMNTYEALDNADEFAKDVMAGRSKGDMPTLFNKKNPLVKLFTAFQLEVNNQYGYMLKDLPMALGDDAKEKLVAAFVKMFLGAYLYNMLSEKITGRKSAFSPIDIALDSYNTLTNNEMSAGEKINSIGTDLVGEAPFIGGIVGGGRLPIQGAIPYDNPISMISDTISNASDFFDGNESQKQSAIKSLTKEWSKPLYYVALPFAGGQLKKTIDGASMYLNDVPGSYTNSGDLRFTVENDIGSKVKATIFGTYANPYAQDYIDSGYKTIKKDNIEEMVGLDMNSTEYRQYKKGLSNASKTTDKNGYTQYVDENNKVYWYDSDTETMYDNNYKKTTLTADDLIKVSKTEEALNYINSLDLTDKQKNIAANNINKNSKKTIDMSEYRNYSSYDEYKYARDYPEKYSVVSQITDYDSFVKYKNDIADIKEKYSTEAGYESKVRKAAIQKYINNLDLNMYQKMLLEKMAGGYSIKNYQSYIREYLDTTNLTQSEKYSIWEELFN